MADEFGQTWTLDRQIGQGGQGQVWLAAGGRTAVKIIGGLRGQEQARAMYAKLQRVRRLPLEGIRIAGVQALLAPPRVGYIMELAGEMFEFSNLQDVPVDFEDDPGQWYLATGGFARRLRLIARLADSVARLHGRAIAYQDLSPGNVLVSSCADYDEVRLIDVDNLTVRSTVAEPAVYTPGYGAPEVVSGASGANTLADAHALAVLIFQTLTTMHPFRGDLVMDGPPQLQEEQADRYLVPWIDHPEDRSNATDRGIAPRQNLGGGGQPGGSPQRPGNTERGGDDGCGQHPAMPDSVAVDGHDTSLAGGAVISGHDGLLSSAPRDLFLARCTCVPASLASRQAGSIPPGRRAEDGACSRWKT